jgi:Holliday junction resolvase RusA-like endonuclease
MNFWIPGEPMPQPRARARAIKAKNGKAFASVYNSYDARTKAWKVAVERALFENFRFGFEDYDKSAFCVSLWFQFARPKNHFRTGKNSHLMKDDAPELHTKKPDVDNLAKLVMDAGERHGENMKAYENLVLSELKSNKIYKNDSQIVKLVSMKSWSADPGCLASIVQIRTFEELLRNTPFDS